jgi:starch synthase (maltosyl-transferring)
MTFVDNDRWAGAISLPRNARYIVAIEAWRDPYASLAEALGKKRAANQDLATETQEAAELIHASPAQGDDVAWRDHLVHSLAGLEAGGAPQVELLLSEAVTSFMARVGPREGVSRIDPALDVVVDRKRALFSAWYELFPRSITDHPDRHGTFRDVIAHLPYVRDLGFDVLYMPPIHPVGESNRKGRNNALHAAPGDPGSVYAIGSPAGGHEAIHPELGTLDDFRALVAAAKAHGLELALDFAVQCSPDHPWIRRHPEWFKWRSDGTIQHAENPPKTYEDIVNVEFYGAAFPSLWRTLRDIALFWVGEGVRILRVDNPHTKPLPFWQWLIAEVTRDYPDVIFLAEAFTRPKLMKKLAKIGFQQSYTYFTWRDAKAEIIAYMRELTGEMSETYRPNFFVNTPDINPYYLQKSGRPGFIVRATLAATLSSNWGVYSGFEFCEAEPLPGREEYLDSEKYEIRVRDFDKPGNIKAHIAALNRIRRDNPALQDFRQFLPLNAWNDQILAYARISPDKSNCVMVLVNLDPWNRQECSYEVPLWEFGLPDQGLIEAEDLLHGGRFTLYGKTHQIVLDPQERPVVIWRLLPPRAGGVA